MKDVRIFSVKRLLKATDAVLEYIDAEEYTETRATIAHLTSLFGVRTTQERTRKKRDGWGVVEKNERVAA